MLPSITFRNAWAVRLFASACCLLHLGSALGQVESWDWDTDSGSSLCGVYAACRLAVAHGLEADPSRYVTNAYVRCDGSTASQLSRIFRELGGRPTQLSRIGWVDTCVVGDPFVANVRSDVTLSHFNHWVVAVPDADGIVLWDGPSRVHHLSPAEFIAAN